MYAHKNDPISSHIAAESAKSSLSQQQRDYLEKTIREHPGLTRSELVVWTRIPYMTLVRRVGDLMGSGRCENGPLKRCPILEKKVSSCWIYGEAKGLKKEI